MSTRELIQAEIEKLDEEELQELYEFIKKLVDSDASNGSESLLSKLMKISIDAPPDFSSKVDLYMPGNEDRE